MKHSHTKIWIHLIWTTKNRERILFEEKGQILYKFLMDIFPGKEVMVHIR